jgi:hypothetical protein
LLKCAQLNFSHPAFHFGATIASAQPAQPIALNSASISQTRCLRRSPHCPTPGHSSRRGPLRLHIWLTFQHATTFHLCDGLIAGQLFSTCH